MRLSKLKFVSVTVVLTAMISAHSALAAALNKIDSKEGYQFVFCERYKLCQDKYDFKELIKYMEASPYPESLKEFWTSPTCKTPFYIDGTLVPVLFDSAVDVTRAEKFLPVARDYFIKKKDLQTWLAAINTTSTNGHTFLDFMKYNIDTKSYVSPNTIAAALRIVSYLCKNGGVYSKYADSAKCPEPAPEPKTSHEWIADRNTGCQVYGADLDAGAEIFWVMWSGTCANGKANGDGILTYMPSAPRSGANQYQGHMSDGKRQGKGTLVWANGNSYEGEWFNGEMHGKGIYTTADGTRFDSVWKNNSSVGAGIATKKDGFRYNATYKDGKLSIEDLPR